MIALFKSAVKTNSEADAALSEAVKNAMETLLQQEKFTSAIQAFQVKLVQDLESLNVELPSYFREMMKIIVSDSKSLLDTIMSRMRGLDSDVAKLRTVSG